MRHGGPTRLGRGRRYLQAIALVALLAGAGGACTSEAPAAPERPTRVRAVLISLDGLRLDAITATNSPTLHQMAKEGAAATNARTVFPSLTLPSHASMLTGLVPDRHGVTWNDDDTSATARPVVLTTVFDLATRAGYHSAMFAGKSKFITLAEAGAPSKAGLPPINQTWPADRVASEALSFLAVARPRPNLLFIHLPDIDLAGHGYGWMSPRYLAAVRHTDSVVARIWQGVREVYGPDLTMIITADHGGYSTTHGDSTALSMTIPWIAWGKGVIPQVLTSDIRGFDTAPTLLWLLGLEVPPGWDGKPVKNAFPALAP